VLPLSGAFPRIAGPSRKVTVPVAVEGVTVAVKVTAWPKMEIGSEDVSTVLVAAGVCPGETVSVTGVEVLGPLLESPPYEAVILWVPDVRVATVKVAVPPARATGAPRVVEPSRKVTDPVAEEGVTVAVR
jgi:hypothetical protein